MRGITFNGVSSQSLGLVMPNDPQVQFPSKIKNKLRIPGTNIIYDRNTKPFSQEFEEREIRCTFNVTNHYDINITNTYNIATKLMNWLMGEPGKKRLILDIMPAYFFTAEVESVGDFETNLLEYGILEVTFTALPYRQRVVQEGHDTWDHFNFETDYVQMTEFDLPTMNWPLSYNNLSIGQMVNLGGWASVQVGSSVAIRHHQTEPFYEIVGKRSSTYDESKGWISFNEYQLDNGFWVREQNIVQARKEYVDVVLRSTSNHSIRPEIMFTGKGVSGSSWHGITLRRKGKYYNLRGDVVGQSYYTNNKFELEPGENNIRIYGQNNYLRFFWRQEVL